MRDARVSSGVWSLVIFNIPDICTARVCQFTKPSQTHHLHSNPNAIICLHPLVDRVRALNSIFCTKVPFTGKHFQ